MGALNGLVFFVLSLFLLLFSQSAVSAYAS